MNNIANKTTFWAFLKQTQIMIPIIQRDYAQGRKGKENLRESFLSSIGKALTGQTQLKLDFVYGSGDGTGRFSPLDGQQRLTTLWLLHWYLAFKTGNLKNPDIRNILQRFSYETRESSKAFIQMLVDRGHKITQNKDESIADAIIRQSWMFSSWRQDPTVQSMLRMLSGEKNSKVDGIEELFQGCTDNLTAYWDRLMGSANTCPIVFFQLDIDNLGQSDDLYVKMNGRGKPLTDFENFKADLIKYFEDQQLEDFLKPEGGYPILMDTTWTDFFWEYRKKEIPFDDLYFTFINRFFLAELMRSVPGLETSNVSDEKRRVYDYLYSFIESKSKRKPYTEIGFGIYRDFFDLLLKADNVKSSASAVVKVCQRLRNLLNNLSSFKQKGKAICVNSPYYNEKEFTPVYVHVNKQDSKQDYYSLTQPQMVVFWAFCYFFEQDDSKDASEESLLNWMRIVWNICDFNGELDTKQAIISAIKGLNDIIRNPTDSYQALLDWGNNQNVIPDEKAFDAHVKEEYQKIKKMEMKELYAGTVSDFNGKTWKDVILDVEKNPFLTGTIRCLLLDDKNCYSWDNFDEKYRHFKYYSGNQMDHIAIRNYLIHDYRMSIFWYAKGSKNVNRWMSLLSQNTYAGSVHRWLMSNPLGERDLASYIRSHCPGDYEKLMVIGSPLLEKVLDERGLYIAKSNCNMNVLMHHQASTPYILMYEVRNKTIKKLLDEGTIELCKRDDWLPVVHMWKTRNLDFKYENKEYTWMGEGKIQMKDSGMEKEFGNAAMDVPKFREFMHYFNQPSLQV